MTRAPRSGLWPPHAAEELQWRQLNLKNGEERLEWAIGMKGWDGSESDAPDAIPTSETRETSLLIEDERIVL